MVHVFASVYPLTAPCTKLEMSADVLCNPETVAPEQIGDTLSSSGAALSNTLPLQGTRQLVPLKCQLSCLRHASQHTSSV